MVKVGDRVRSLVDETDLCSNKIYEVVSVGRHSVNVEDDAGDEHFLFEDEYEPVAVADSNGNVEHGNRFKVGDRVKTDGGYSFDPNEGVILKANVGGDSDLYKVDVPGGHSFDDDGWHYRTGQLQAAPLTIRSGRFYRTRDGRKVGPAEVSDDYEYPWRASGALYLDNGRWLYDDIEDDNDIIAEWPDEPAVAPTPTTGFTVPLDAPEFGGAESKFKVGDRVETRGDFSFDPALGTINRIVDGVYKVLVGGQGEDYEWNYSESELRLVAEATTAQEPPTSIADIVRRLERLESAMWQRAA